MKIGDKLFLHCGRCNVARLHIVLYTDIREESQSDKSGIWSLDHTLTRGFVECEACSWPKIHVHVFSEPIEQEDTFSVPAEPARTTPVWAKKLPADMCEVLNEVLTAYTDKRLWLVVMGCRTLIDMFALERLGDCGGFAAKLRKLEAEGYLSTKDRMLVEQAVEVGHGATHRRTAPTRGECSAVLDITEHLL